MFKPKIVNLLLNKQALNYLSGKQKIGTYTPRRLKDGTRVSNEIAQREGVLKLRTIAFIAIKGLLKAHLKKDFEQMAQILMETLGNYDETKEKWFFVEEKFIEIFGKTPLIKSRCPYFGSFMAALMKSFPECEINEFMFKKFSKNYLDQENVKKKIIQLAKKTFGFKTDKEAIQHLRGMDKANTLFKKKKEGLATLKQLQQLALGDLFNLIEVKSQFKVNPEDLLIKHPRKFAKQVLTFVHSEETFKEHLGFALLLKAKYKKELKQDPDFAINWKVALEKLLPQCFPNKSSIDNLAKGSNIKLGPVKTELEKAQDRALVRLYSYLVKNNHVYTDYRKSCEQNPSQFARIVILYVHSDKSFRKILRGTLLHRNYYRELKKDVSFSINWQLALRKLLPKSFPEEKSIENIAIELGIEISPLYRESWWTSNAAG